MALLRGRQEGCKNSLINIVILNLVLLLEITIRGHKSIANLVSLDPVSLDAIFLLEFFSNYILIN